MTQGTGPFAAHQHEAHGSIGEEAAKLAEAVQQWLGERTSGNVGDVWAAATATGAFESPECTVCPVCRAMRFVTSVQPEVLGHLADAATSFAAAVRAMGESRAAGPPASEGDLDGEA